jgi:N-acetylglucosaminyldiphosphoundecaprenol N-acetyl-beta-D-mannosaminyltransferase
MIDSSLRDPKRKYIPPEKFPILSVGVNPVNMQSAVKTIGGWISNRDQHYVCVTPAHSIMDAYYNPSLKQIFNHSGLTTPDGMAIVWLLRMRGFSQVERVYGPDLMRAVCQRSLEAGWRHYFYGGQPGVAEQLSDKLITQFPGLIISGVFSPPFRDLTLAEDQEIVSMVNDASPDIVWVGIGSPKQEIWMSSHLGLVKAPVFIGVGAAFDFLSGMKRQAPHWIQRSGFEWLFRLVTEPKRLWRRYARYPLFLLLVSMQLLGIIHDNTDHTQ